MINGLVEGGLPETVLGTVVAGIFACLVALIQRQRRSDRAIEETRDHAAATRDQVQNTHSTNLRHDLDGVARDVRTILALTRQNTLDIGALTAAIEAAEQRLAEHIETAAIIEAELRGGR